LREGDPSDALVVDLKTNTHVLPVGSRTPVANPSDLLDTPALPALLAKLRDRFATIIVDLPALESACGARAVAPLLDGCILVAIHGRTSLRALEDAIDVLRGDNVSVFGVVIADASDDIPPLLGLHLDEVRDFDYVNWAHSMQQRLRRAG
jgi:Mrp family chromosome partitioning ATPase